MTEAVRRAVVVAGGHLPPADRLRPILDGDRPFVVAADSGLDHAFAMGWAVDLVVGDLDSASSAALARARADGTPFETHPASKDATDLELALLAARDRGAAHVTVVGGGGGRLDHLLANLLVLAAPAFADMEVDAYVGTAHVVVVRHRSELHGRPGELCSLVPVGGPALGVRTSGLRFPLRGEDLHPGTTRGISNELLTETATVEIAAGVVLAVLPHVLQETN